MKLEEPSLPSTRRMRAFALSAIAFLLVAGCATPGDDKTPPPARDDSLQAPWWAVGEWWEVDIARKGGPAERFKLVNFWNDSGTDHFWLGVADRAQALDMALHDDNPLLGRIHWNILTPHEKGIHAHGLYNFPVEDGEEFGGLAFGGQWSITAQKADKPGQFIFKGKGTKGERIEYDYLASNNWFSYVDIRDESGTSLWRIDVRNHGTGATGAYWFLRGRDYHASTDPSGTKEETFQVKDEGTPHKSLALEFAGTSEGLLRIDVLDPDGQVRHSETLTGGKVSSIVEVPSPKIGKWTIRYAGTGALKGSVEAVGILEYTRTL